MVLLLGPTPIYAQFKQAPKIEERRLEDALNNLGLLGLELKNTFEWFERKSSFEVFVPFALRISAAEEQYLLRDYRKAALMLHPLVGSGNRPTEPLFERGVFYLAQSHLNLGNKVAAKQHFRRLIDSKEYGLTSAHRMVEIAVTEKRAQDLPYYLEALERQPTLSPQAIYAMTQGYLLLVDYERAGELALRIPEDHALKPKAAFIHATSLVATGQYREALGEFAKLETTLSPSKSEGLHDLAVIHQARLLLALGELQPAHQAYQRIPRGSPQFDDALYEMAWLQLHRASDMTDASQRSIELNRARASIDMLLLLSDDENLRSEAHILLANILMKLKRGDEAANVFALNTQRYEPVIQAIDLSIMNIIDSSDWYQRLMTSERKRRAFLPSIARKVLNKQRGIESARDLMGELETARQTVVETRKLLDDFRKKIADDPYGNFLPSVRTSFAKARDLRKMHESITETMKAATLALIEPTLPRDKQVELAGYQAELSKLKIRTNNSGTATARERELNRTISVLLKEGRQHLIAARPEESHQSARINPELARLGIQRRELSTERARLEELILTTREQTFNFTWTKKRELQELRKIVSWADKVGQELSADLIVQVVESIESHRTEVASSKNLEADAKRRQERKTLTLVLQGMQLQRTLLERKFKQTFERERTLLLSGSVQDFQSGIWLAISLEQAERVLEHDRGQIEALEERCREFARTKLEEIDMLLARENRLLDEQRSALTLAEARAKRAIGKLTGKAVELTRAHIANLLMRSDMGLLDVAWWKKEQLTTQINQVLSESNEKRRIFNRDMKTLLRED